MIDWTITTIKLSGDECQRGEFGTEMKVTPRMTEGGNIVYHAWSSKRGQIGEGARGKAFRSFNAAKRAVEAAHNRTKGADHA